MKNSIIIVLMGLALILTNCGRSDKGSSTVVMQDPPIEEVEVIQDHLAIHKTTLAQFVDPSPTGTEDFIEMFNSLILTEGQVRETEAPEALELFKKFIDTPSQESGLPLFEVKNTQQVVLTVAGRGVQALILVDNIQLTIEKIEFLPKSKTKSLGSGVQRLQDQLMGKAITFNPNNFGLKPWDGPKFEGDVQLEGISGATDICQSVADALNQQLPRYQTYFESDS